MSYIDTFDHEFVGLFAGLPLYHPLETVQGTPSTSEFSCSPDNLVLGGGSGEHLAVVFTNLGCAATYFLQFSLEVLHESLLPVKEDSMKILNDMPPAAELLQFPGWNVKAYASFYNRCRVPTFTTPFDPEKHRFVEQWLLYSIGEFIYFSMPELAQTALLEIPDICQQIQKPFLFNVTILPPGYHVPYGRKRTQSGEIIWGNYPWTTQRRTDTQES